MGDEDEEIDQKQEVIAQNEKARIESEIYVAANCKLRLDVDTRAISFESLRLRLKRWTFVSLLNLPLKTNNKAVINSEFYIIGILSHKLIKTSKNNNKYLLIKLDDFKASISCFIFNAEIIEKFYKIQEGTILVIAGPKLMSDGGSKPDNGKNFDLSLKIEEAEQILVVGKSIDFAFCGKIDNNHKRCPTVINKSKDDLCTFHKTESYKKYASKRNDTNRSGLTRLRTNGKKTTTNRRTNGVSMMQRRKPMSKQKQAPKPTVNWRQARNNNANLLLSSSAMTTRYKNKIQKKYAVGDKNLKQMDENEKKKKMNKLLAGKTLIPHLGANWSTANGKSNAQISFVLEPKAMKVGKIKPSKKRKYESMSVETECEGKIVDGLPRKRSKVDKINCDSKTEEVDCERMQSLDIADDDDDEQKEIISCMNVKIFCCKQTICSMKDKQTEKLNEFCRPHLMNVTQTIGKKYFWKCIFCNLRTTTLNTKRVRKKCKNPKCGKKKYTPASVDKTTV